MTSDPLLFKIELARDYLNELEVEVERWLSGNHYTVVTKRDPEQPWYVLEGTVQYLVLASAEAVPLRPFVAIITNFLQSMRSGLDHVAYRLANSFTIPLPDDVAQDSEFPIFGDEDRKGNPGSGARLYRNAARKIRGIDPAAQAIIEALQPYQRGNDFASDPLWKLNELGRIDKHRFLCPVAYHFSGASIDVSRSMNAIIGPGIMQTFEGAIETDTVILRYPARAVDVSLPMHVDFKPVISIAFPYGSAAANEDVVRSLGAIYNHVVQRVLPPLMPFIHPTP